MQKPRNQADLQKEYSIWAAKEVEAHAALVEARGHLFQLRKEISGLVGRKVRVRRKRR